MFSADKILEALRLAAEPHNQPPQMLLADDAEQFRPHGPSVLLQQLQQSPHALVIDLSFRTEELKQGHVGCAEVAQDVLLLLGRAHSPELAR